MRYTPRLSSIISSLKLGVAAISTLVLSSCVHEWPDSSAIPRDVEIDVTHLTEWTETEHLITRANAPHTARYHFLFYRAGETSYPRLEMEFTRDDLSRAGFTCHTSLPAGNYDLYAWSDYADADSEKSVHFDSSDFSKIIYSGDYIGNTHTRDAFRGITSFSVDDSPSAHYMAHVDLALTRPFARYEIIATDFDEFVQRETTRRDIPDDDSRADAPLRIPNLDKYRIKMSYSGYMPNTFNNHLNRPVNSAIGVTYDSSISKVSDTEARLALDYVMVNGAESSVQVAMEVYDPDGNLIGTSGSFSIPTLRGRNTIVKGKFLTSQASGGVGISPDFNGEFNIEIR